MLISDFGRNAKNAQIQSLENLHGRKEPRQAWRCRTSWACLYINKVTQRCYNLERQSAPSCTSSRCEPAAWLPSFMLETIWQCWRLCKSRDTPHMLSSSLETASLAPALHFCLNWLRNIWRTVKVSEIRILFNLCSITVLCIGCTLFFFQWKQALTQIMYTYVLLKWLMYDK